VGKHIFSLLGSFLLLSSSAALPQLTSLTKISVSNGVYLVSSTEPANLDARWDAGKYHVYLNLEAPSNKAVRVHFQNYHLSPGVQVSLYRSGDSAPPVKAKYTATGPLHSGEFWSLPVRGPLVMIELKSPIYLETLPFEIHEAALADLSEDSFESEQETKVEVRDSLYRGTAVRHLVIDGMAVWEGDIVLGRADELEPYSKGSSLRQSLVLNGPEVRWPGGDVPYVIDPTLPNQE